MPRGAKAEPAEEGPRPAVAPGTKCVALFDFGGTESEDLQFKKGDTLIIENVSFDPFWWCAKDKSGNRGVIPANYVEIIEGAVGTAGAGSTGTIRGEPLMPWFHGKITREMAEELLEKSSKRDGLFLVRESTNFPGDYTLCVCCEGTVDHYHIQSQKGKLTIDEEEFFESLDDIIKHYSKDSDGLSTVLREPLKKKGGKAHAKDLAKFEIDPRHLTRAGILGSGQFGDVHMGTYRDKPVAIKTLKNVDKEATAAFLSEADVMTRLRHENLVQLLGVILKSDPIMIVVEFMAKGCLLDFLRSRGRSVITPAMQLRLTKDICAAMVYLESEKFVHRDLAARNILLGDLGNEELIAKVADFGLAKDSRWGDIDAGKLPIKWTAPEALRQKVSTSKSDVWSYGVVMWEVYSFGRTPYPKMNQKEVVDSVLGGHRMEKPDSCPQDLYDKVMIRCWELDPLKRPSFKDTKATLDKFKVKM